MEGVPLYPQALQRKYQRNGWWIDKIGEYDFKIEFEPQGKVTIGLYLAIFGGGVLISLIIFQKFKKYERN